MAFIFSFQRNQEKFAKAGIFLTFLAAGSLFSETMRSISENGQLSSTAVLLAGILCLMTLVGQIAFKISLAGIFTLPISTLLLLLDLFQSPARYIATYGSQSIYRNLHIMSAILGEAMAIGAFSISMLYLWQHKNLKHKTINHISNKLPALEKLSSLLDICLWAGMIFLSIALISGAFYSSQSLEHSGLTIKILWALAVWGWYMAILVIKNVLKKRPKFVAKLSLVGFFLLATSLFGIIL